jgi:hypothetical protein
MFSAGVAECRQVEAFRQVFAGPEHDRSYRKMHLVNELRLKILANRGNTASEPDVLSIRGLGGLLERGMDPASDKAELGASIHRDGRPGMVCEHEDRCVIRRVLAPPPLPGAVRPRPANWPEHVSTHDPGSYTRKAARRKLLIRVYRSAVFAVHLPKGASRDDPVVQREAAGTQRVVQVLARARTLSVEGDRKGVHTKLRHRLSPRRRLETSRH